MDTLLRGLSRTEGSVKDRVGKLKLDMQYPNPASEERRAQIMSDINGILADALKRSALLFDLRPQSPIVAQALPRFRENNAAPNYNPPEPDGSRPGIFQYTRRIQYMTKFGLRSVVYHEAVPGHHFQIALEVEGWALYAERLAAESGWYGNDMEGLLGQMDKVRARRLVVDTGLHAMKWTRQQGIDYGASGERLRRHRGRQSIGATGYRAGSWLES
jgi:uncharacterized protein (DUF885 family)